MKAIFWPERPGMRGPAGAVTVNSADELRVALGLG